MNLEILLCLSCLMSLIKASISFQMALAHLAQLVNLLTLLSHKDLLPLHRVATRAEDHSGSKGPGRSSPHLPAGAPSKATPQPPVCGFISTVARLGAPPAQAQGSEEQRKHNGKP